MIYDDGSYDETINGITYAFDTSGDVASATQNGGYVATPGYENDYREQSKLGSFYPPSAPWWQGLATYGATRAIDAQFGPPAGQQNGYGTYAGANGRTYAQGPLTHGMNGGDDGNGLILLALAGLALYALVS